MQKEPWETIEPPAPIDPKAYRLVAPGHSEFLAGLIYLPIHFLLMSILIEFVLLSLGIEYTLLELNLLFFSIGTIYLLIAMRRYLRESFGRFLHFGLSNLWVMLAGYGIRIGLNIPVILFVASLLPEIVSPNEQVVRGIIDQNLLLSLLMTVILAPILEELLFRGVLFAPLRKHGRALAYFVSTFFFALLHVIVFLFLTLDPNLLLIMLLYVPAGIAFCWVYEKSGSIWTAIFLHALMNLVAVFLPMILPEFNPEVVVSIHQLFITR